MPSIREHQHLLIPAVVAAVVAVQFVIGTFDRFLEWDESVYFSQVATGHLAADFASQRSRMVSLIAWPMGLVTDSVMALRIYLVALVSGGSLLLGRRLMPYGVGAPLGLALFLVSTMPLFYAAELSPNLWVALFALWIATLVASPLRTRGWDLSALFLSGAALVMLRPPDGVLFLTGVGLVILARSRLRDITRLSSLAAGAVSGLAIWALDAISRFGSVTAVVEDGSQQATAAIGFRLALYADRLDGPTRGLNFDGISPVALIPWLLLAVMGVIAAVRRAGGDGSAPDQTTTDFAWLLGVGGVLLAAEYIVGSAGQAVRYIFPGWLLLSVLTAMLALPALTADIRAGVAWGLATVLLVTQVGVLGSFATDQAEERQSIEVAGEFLATTAGGRCAAATQYGAPQVSFAANCPIAGLRGPEDTIAYLQARAAEGNSAYLMLFGEPSDGYEHLGEYSRLDIDGTRYWSVLEVPAG